MNQLLHFEVDLIQNISKCFWFFSIEKLRPLEIKELKEYSLNLEHSLKYNNSDIDGMDLFLELKISREITQVENNSSIEILDYIRRLDSFTKCIYC